MNDLSTNEFFVLSLGGLGIMSSISILFTAYNLFCASRQFAEQAQRLEQYNSSIYNFFTKKCLGTNGDVIIDFDGHNNLRGI